MKLKSLYEALALKKKELQKQQKYSFLETENYIFLQLPQKQILKLTDPWVSLWGSMADNYQEISNCMAGMNPPSVLNKDTLLRFYNKNIDYFTIGFDDDYEKLIASINSFKSIFNKNYMGYSDWDICTDIDLKYEMSNIIQNNINNHDALIQTIDTLKLHKERGVLSVSGQKYSLKTKQVEQYEDEFAIEISFICKRK